jgi:hypothetical protein
LVQHQQCQVIQMPFCTHYSFDQLFAISTFYKNKT